MGVEVVIGTVGNPDRLDPAEALRVHLGVPAVSRVMRPLVGKVLAEPERPPDPDRNQQVVGKSDVISDVLVCDDALIHCLPHRHLDRRFAFLLVGIGQEGHPVIGISLEGRVMVLLVRVNKDFGLRLREFAEPDHALPGEISFR